MTITFLLDLPTTTTANAKGHWRKAWRIAKEQRLAAFDAMLRATPGQPARLALLPCTITLTRISPYALDDDNLRSALKHVRDGLADALVGEVRLFRRQYRVIGDDRDPRLTWVYAQRKGQPKQRAVEVVITPREDA